MTVQRLSLPPLPLWSISAPYARALLMMMAAEAGHPECSFGGLIAHLGGREVALRHLAWARAHTLVNVSESDYSALRTHAVRAGESEAAMAACAWVEDVVARWIVAVVQQRQ